MRTSVVGLVNRFGLEALLPECATTCRWLQQAAHNGKAVCIWAVLEQSVADEIAEIVATGNCGLALQRLSCDAECYGPLDRVEFSDGNSLS